MVRSLLSTNCWMASIYLFWAVRQFRIPSAFNRVASVVGPGKGGAVLVHVGTNDVDKKGSEEVMGRYRELVVGRR